MNACKLKRKCHQGKRQGIKIEQGLRHTLKVLKDKGKNNKRKRAKKVTQSIDDIFLSIIKYTWLS